MKKSIWFRSMCWIITIASLAACAGNGGTPALAGTSWKLVSYGEPANPTPALAEINATLVFDSKSHVGGNAGCNSFGGEYTIHGDQISFGQVVSTMMACPGARMAQEQAVLNVFSGTARLSLENDRLAITSSDGTQSVTFTRAGK